MHLQQDVGAEYEREEHFVSLHQRATHVTVETVREVIGQVAQASLHDLRLVAVQRHRNTHDEKAHQHTQKHMMEDSTRKSETNKLVATSEH